MGYDAIGFLHFVAAVSFGGFILLDRLAFRRFAASLEGGSDGFYRALRPWLMLIALVLILSGGTLLGLRPESIFSLTMIVKLTGAVVLLALFFYCPVFAAKAGAVKRFAYRLLVLLLLLAVLYLGRSI